MTSRQLPPPATSVVGHHRRQSQPLYFAIVAAFPFVIFLLLALLFIYTYFLHRPAPNLPSDSPLHPGLRRFSYQELHAATAGFAASHSLGRGATATVFLGILANGESVAIKLLDLPTSPPAVSSGDHEFLNELQVLSNLRHSAFVVSLLGYCIEGDHRRLIVYEYMSNGSLQELLFNPHRRLIDWSRRFQIILDLAKALTFLHLSDPPIIHGDIKPGNVLLGHDLQAKISDFGLSRLKIEAADSATAESFGQALLSGSTHMNIILPIRPSSSSSSSCLAREKNVRLMGKESAVSPCDDEVSCIENNDFGLSFQLDDGRDCRWKKDKRSGISSRDHVRENPTLDEIYKSSLEFRNVRLEEGSLDKALFRDSCLGANGCNEKDRKIREWWKEEYFEEIRKKGEKRLKCFKTINRCHKDHDSSYNGYNNHRGGTELNFNVSIRNGWKKKSRLESNEMSSGNPFSEEISGTRSARGTVSYVAPECSDCDNLTEKADIYSFGVLILVIISGRRPLHVLESPMELDRANLINWCRKLAQTGNVLDIMDENLKDSYDKDQARHCINVALLCLQRKPDLRPDSRDIVKVLEGEKELPIGTSI